METKEQLVNNIKEWIKLDTEVSELKAQIKEKTNKKKGLTENLVTVMKTNKIDCFDINNGKLLYTKTKVKAPLSKVQLMQALSSYYNHDEDQVRELGDHLMAARQEKITESIRRKSSK